MRRTLGALATVMLLALIGGCSDEVRPEAHSVIAVDLTKSFAQADRDLYVKQQVTDALGRMSGSGTVAVLGFSSEVGTSNCVAPTATLTWAGNTEKYETAKKAASTQLLAALPDYFSCAEASVQAKKSSDVLGALAQAQAMLAGRPDSRAIVMISDGCQNTYKIKTCMNDKMLDPDWRAQSLSGLPGALRPDLSGTDLIMQGVAVNSGMQQTGVDALKSFYREFSKLTSAKSISFV